MDIQISKSQLMASLPMLDYHDYSLDWEGNRLSLLLVRSRPMRLRVREPLSEAEQRELRASLSRFRKRR